MRECQLIILVIDRQDEDFVAEKDDSGSPTDESEEEGSDASADRNAEDAGEDEEVCGSPASIEQFVYSIWQK